jgi:hypothetical protein
MKKNSIVICPFNPNHKIQSSKIDSHILKSHPGQQKYLLYCVNNASCKFLEKDKNKHFEKCFDCRQKYKTEELSKSMYEQISKKMEFEKTFNDEVLNITEIKQNTENNELSNDNTINEINETKIL